ncbi:hypothetical protein COCON_G00122070 [Conger conger]|uniref:Interleukin n=1 Tax=Conger conger TaxID=82655 RepID=A0A9Q1DHY4_CONCO|nr:hypothetical protein COCON_G00122070 [Conger conger]
MAPYPAGLAVRRWVYCGQKGMHMLSNNTQRSVRQACFFCCFRYCQDWPPNGEIWISFFFLSCLCTYISVAEAQRQSISELRQFLCTHEQDFKTSGSTYYTPGYETISDACFNKTLLCYIVETQVILYETKGERSPNILEPMAEEFQKGIERHSCLPCEAFEETNATTFLQNFHTFLQKIEDAFRNSPSV